jgi:hypothetical protein
MRKEMSVKEPEPADLFAPRRSQHISSNLTISDGEVWQEKLAVCEGTSPNGEPRLLIRSFYRNKRSGDRVWDEPPSGAGTVLHATAEMRKKAEMQKEELQLTLEMIPPEEEKDRVSVMTNSSKEKVGFLGRFRKRSKPKKEVEASKDLNLQRAIARSIADQNHGTLDEPIIHYDEENDERFETSTDHYDDDLALAKALSISESAVPVVSNDTLTEEELFQRALEQSQRYSRYNHATGVASIPNVLEDESSSSLSTLTQPFIVGKRDPNESILNLPTAALDDFTSTNQ